MQRGPDGLYVFLVGDDDKVGMQTVNVSDGDDGQSVVASGLTLGKKVVVGGQYRLQPGSVVQASEAPASKALAKAAQDNSKVP